MKHKPFYKFEQINLITAFMLAIGLLGMGYITYRRLTDPYNWAPNGFLAAMVFIGLWNVIAAWFVYTEHKKRKEFLEKRDIVITEGRAFDGEVIDTKEEVSYRRDSDGHTYKKYKYFAKIKFNNGNEDITYWTPELAFDPKQLTSEKVIVHMNRDEFYAHGFQIGNKVKKSLKTGSKIYLICFLIFWFGFLIFFDYLALKQINADGFQLLLFSLIFWAFGIYIAFKGFKR